MLEVIKKLHIKAGMRGTVCNLPEGLDVGAFEQAGIVLEDSRRKLNFGPLTTHSLTEAERKLWMRN